MKTEKIIGLIVGGFVLLLFLSYGVFSDIIKGFVEGFGLGHGLVLGVLICLIIVLAVFGGKGR